MADPFPVPPSTMASSPSSNGAQSTGTLGTSPTGPAGTTEAQTSEMSPATARFKSCRWRRPPDEGVECCGHRDVLPLAGSTGFDPEAWCPDCAFYKLRRTPQQRNPNDYRY